MKQPFTLVDDMLSDPTDREFAIPVTALKRTRGGARALAGAAAASVTHQTLDERLRRVRSGDGSDVLRLVAVCDEPGVREALLEGLVAATAEHVTNLAQVVAIVAPPGGVAALGQKLRALPATDSRSRFRLGAVAASLLCLDPSDDFAATTLCAQLSDGHVGVRAFAAARACECDRPHSEAHGLRRVRAAIAPLVDDVTQVFIAALPLLLRVRGDEARRRVTQTLDGFPDVSALAWSLAGIAGDEEQWAAALLRSAAPGLPDEVALELAARSPYGYSPDVLERCAVQALMSEAPSARLDGVRILSELSDDVRRRVAGAAVSDEPDERIRELLESQTRSS